MWAYRWLADGFLLLAVEVEPAVEDIKHVGLESENFVEHSHRTTEAARAALLGRSDAEQADDICEV